MKTNQSPVVEQVVNQDETGVDPEVAQLYQYVKENDLREEAVSLIDKALEAKKVNLVQIVAPQKKSVIAKPADPTSKTEKSFKEIRKSLGFNQTEMAKQLGLSQGMISLLENNRFPINSEVKTKLDQLMAA
jgi:DNA-binding XRE family transcriptional regulator